jgi:hypothetical protein
MTEVVSPCSEETYELEMGFSKMFIVIFFPNSFCQSPCVDCGGAHHGRSAEDVRLYGAVISDVVEWSVGLQYEV